MISSYLMIFFLNKYFVNLENLDIVEAAVLDNVVLVVVHLVHGGGDSSNSNFAECKDQQSFHFQPTRLQPAIVVSECMSVQSATQCNAPFFKCSSSVV